MSAVDPRDVKAQLNTHEAVCAIRYDGINARLKRLEWVLLTGGGTIIVLLVKLVLKVN